MLVDDRFLFRSVSLSDIANCLGLGPVALAAGRANSFCPCRVPGLAFREYVHLRVPDIRKKHTQG